MSNCMTDASKYISPRHALPYLKYKNSYGNRRFSYIVNHSSILALVGVDGSEDRSLLDFSSMSARNGWSISSDAEGRLW